jgi:hypothetical protein
MKEQTIAESEEQEKVKKTKPVLLSPSLHKEKKDYERGRERPVLAVLGDKGSRVFGANYNGGTKRVVSCLQLLPQGRTHEQDCRQSLRVCIYTVYPKPEEPKKDKKLTKREAGISYKMEMAEIRLRFGQYRGAPVTTKNQD